MGNVHPFSIAMLVCQRVANGNFRSHSSRDAPYKTISHCQWPLHRPYVWYVPPFLVPEMAIDIKLPNKIQLLGGASQLGKWVIYNHIIPQLYMGGIQLYRGYRPVTKWDAHPSNIF